jgi:hypothetical protein
MCQLKSRFSTAPELPFAEELSEESIRVALREEGVSFRDCLYAPWVTLWVFLSQVLSADHSCRDAVVRLLSFRTARGLAPCSTNTGAYCTARRRLPESLLDRLVRQTGDRLQQQALAEWHWHGRPVKIVDGTTVSMPDTPANEAAFGKADNQHGPTGFPVARLVCVLSLATGAILRAAMGPYRGKQTGELSLFRRLHDACAAGDVLLGDRLFCNYGDVARMQARGVDIVFAHDNKRVVDFRRGRRLGKDDHLVTWTKPSHRPVGIDREEFGDLAKRLTLRELRVRFRIPGFRVRQLVVVTTLLDPQEFSVSDIAALYRQRWQAELDLRSIKCVLQMDVLRCQSPDMVRKEIRMHFLAWNLLRSVMCSAAVENEMPVRTLSFKATQQTLGAFYQQLVTADQHRLESLCTTLLNALLPHRVGGRPDRYEPRKLKRHPKPYPYLKLSRAEERKLCL